MNTENKSIRDMLMSQLNAVEGELREAEPIAQRKWEEHQALEEKQREIGWYATYMKVKSLANQRSVLKKMIEDMPEGGGI